jgi:hypothetical protein
VEFLNCHGSVLCVAYYVFNNGPESDGAQYGCKPLLNPLRGQVLKQVAVERHCPFIFLAPAAKSIKYLMINDGF